MIGSNTPPMLFPLLALVVGVGAGMGGAGFWLGGACVIIAAGIWLVLQFAGRDPLRGFRLRKLHYIWIFLIFLGLGIIDTDFNRPFRMPYDNFDMLKCGQGRITKISHGSWGDKYEVDVWRLIGKDGKHYNTPNFKAIIQGDVFTKDVDDVIVFPANFQRIVDPPDSTLPGYAKRLERQGIYYRLRTSDKNLHYTHTSPTFTGYCYKCRDRLEAFIENTHLAKETQSFLITVLLGDRAYLSEETRSLFADAGVSHILALSGMHIMIIAGIFMTLLFPLNFRGWYRQRRVIATIMIFLYAFITGCAPSTIRACIMAACITVAMLYERKNSAMNALLLATFIILLFTPLAIFDVGLQLSFVCVASLILFMKPLNPVDQHKHNRTYKLMAAILAPIIATGASWVLTGYYFGEISVMFLLGNIVILPLLPFYMVAALLYLLLHAVGADSALLAWGLDTLYSGGISALEWMSCGGKGSLRLALPLWGVWGWFGAIAAGWLLSLRLRRRLPYCKPGGRQRC